MLVAQERFVLVHVADPLEREVRRVMAM